MTIRAIYCCGEELTKDESESYDIDGICPICNENWGAEAEWQNLCLGCLNFKVNCVGGEDCGAEDA
jgi:hypothetical protein